MESSRLTVGVITEPSGAHLELYLPALASSPGIEAVALADRSGRTFQTAANIFTRGPIKFQVFKDAVEMLRTVKPSLALITLEAHHAPSSIEAALEWNCHVLAEKPACTRSEDFARLVRIADSKHRHLMLAFANRLSPPVRKARELIQEGYLGKLYGIYLTSIADQARLTTRDYQQSWFASKVRAGGGHGSSVSAGNSILPLRRACFQRLHLTGTCGGECGARPGSTSCDRCREFAGFELRFRFVSGRCNRYYSNG
jgi:predicted dehydrogenase